MSKRLLIIACACLFLGTGCQLIYKQNIQQGNALEQEDLDQLEVGMTRNQVSFLLGTPAIQDPFNQDRWDYVSTFSRRGGDPVRRLVTLEFEEDRLVSMLGVDAAEGQAVLTEDGAETVESATPRVGVRVEDARDYEDLRILKPGDGLEEWTLQFGSYSTREAADLQVSSLAKLGIEARVYGQVLANTGFFIVRAGAFASLEEATAELARIEAQHGVKAFAVTPGG